jgi:hypothetical protein
MKSNQAFILKSKSAKDKEMGVMLRGGKPTC